MGESVNEVSVDAVDPTLSLSERAYRLIRDRLVMLEIAPGSPINEERLAVSIGVGRTPMREALKRLEHERLVAVYPRRGTFATDVNITDLAHISEVRQRLEPLAAATAATRATAAERTALSELAREAAATDSDLSSGPDRLMRLDLRIHRALYVATHNPFLQDTLVSYDNLATRIWCLFLERLPGMAGHVRQHEPLIRAVVAGEPDTAAALASAHVAHFEQEVRSLL